MSDTSVAILRLAHGTNLPLPEYATTNSAGVDLLAALPAPIALKPGTHKLIPTGISIALPTGYEAQVRPRSGLATLHGVTVLNSPGTIDADYRGEICVILINHGQETFTIEVGMRVAQMVIAPVSRVGWREVTELPVTVRSSGGFGSTGITAGIIKHGGDESPC